MPKKTLAQRITAGERPQRLDPCLSAERESYVDCGDIDFGTLDLSGSSAAELTLNDRRRLAHGDDERR